jgi:hypothetical protein
MKFFGTLMFPSNKYMVLKFTNKDVICEDILESMVLLLSSLACHAPQVIQYILPL